MKQKTLLFGALGMLLMLILFMVKDLFWASPEPGNNPWKYDLETMKKADTMEPAYTMVKTIPSGLQGLVAIATGPGDKIFTTGAGGAEIYDSACRLLLRFDFEDTAYALTVDSTGNLWMSMGDHVEVWNKTGKKLQTLKSAGRGSLITSLALTGSSLLIADAGLKVVYHYDHMGNMINRIGEKDPVRKVPGFVIPGPWFDLAVSPDGSLWIANPGRHELEQYRFDGQRLLSWGKPGIGIPEFCGCCNPSHFTFLPDGSFVTSEKGIERIKVYNPRGKFSAVVALPGDFDEGTRGLDLATDSRGRILVVDPVRKQIRIFVKRSTTSNN